MAKKVIRFKKLTDIDKVRREKVAGNVATGLLASRGQHPYESLQANAEQFAQTVVILTDALLAELGKG